MDVVCWCCENFTLKHTRITKNEIVEIVDGTCALKNSFVFCIDTAKVVGNGSKNVVNPAIAGLFWKSVVIVAIASSVVPKSSVTSSKNPPLPKKRKFS